MPSSTLPTMSLVLPVQLRSDSENRFDEQLEACLHKRPEAIEIDSSQLEVVTSGHVALLVHVYKTCREAGVIAKLVSPTPDLVRVLQALDLYEFFVDGHESDAMLLMSTSAGPDIAAGTEEVYSDDFSVDAEGVSRASESFRQALKRLSVSPLIAFELKTVFYEAATNIRSHACLSCGDQVKFESRATKSQITLIFTDSGRPFDPTMIPVEMDLRKAAANRQRHGFGIAMIRRMTDGMSYVRRDNTMNVLKLERQWS